MMQFETRDEIARALETLEHGLRSVAAGPRRAWRRRLLRDLRPLDECLRAHCAAADGAGGTLADVEIAIGRLHEVTAARGEHDRLRALVADLFREIERARDAAYFLSQDRHAGARLADALRHHLMAETDLLQIRYTLDVGVLD